MMYDEDLGKTIKQRRLSMEMTLYDLSTQSGVSPSHLGRIERGERFPSARILRKIAEPLGYEEHELFLLAKYLTPKQPEDTFNHSGHLDPYVARILSEEPVEVQRAVVGIVYILKSLAKNK